MSVFFFLSLDFKDEEVVGKVNIAEARKREREVCVMYLYAGVQEAYLLFLPHTAAVPYHKRYLVPEPPAMRTMAADSATA